MRSETADIAIELSMQPWHAFRPDGVIMFSDILTPLPAMGIEFDVVRGKGPIIQEPIRREDQLRELRMLDDPDSSLPFIRQILSALRTNVGDASTVLGFIGTPWTLAAYAMEGAADRHCMQTKRIMMNKPELLHALLRHLTECLTVYVCHQIDCGAQVVQLFDSWAHHLSPAQFAEFSLPYAEQIIRDVHARHPDTPLIFHANGGSGKVEEMARCSASVIGLDWSIDIGRARSTLGADRVVQGNVDPMVLFGSEAVITAEVERILRGAGPTRHILNVGHGVAQGTPEENVALFCDLARRTGSGFGAVRELATV